MTSELVGNLTLTAALFRARISPMPEYYFSKFTDTKLCWRRSVTNLNDPYIRVWCGNAETIIFCGSCSPFGLQNYMII